MTNKYIGQECVVCGKAFSDGDDIVVCPDCGTPYHRDCWNEKGECVNTSLHESGDSWQPSEADASVPHESAEQLRCIQCGCLNPAGKKFCGHCGTPLTVGRDAERPFNDFLGQDAGTQGGNFHGYGSYNNPGNFGGFGASSSGIGGFGTNVMRIKLTEESDLSGVRFGDFIEYVGKTSMGIIANFVKFAKTGMKTSFNFGALFFPEFYFFYRKMNKLGIVSMLLAILFSVPALIYYGQSGEWGRVFFSTPININGEAFQMLVTLCSMLNSILSVLACLFANFLYYKKARKDIIEIRSDNSLDDIQKKNKIHELGGTSWQGVVMAFVMYLGIPVLFVMVMALIF